MLTRAWNPRGTLLLGNICRRFSHSQTVVGAEKCASPPSRGLVLGIYSDSDEESGLLTPNAAKYNEVCGFDPF